MQTSYVQRSLRKSDLICPRSLSVHTGVGVLEVRKCSKMLLFYQSATDRSHVVLFDRTQELSRSWKGNHYSIHESQISIVLTSCLSLKEIMQCCLVWLNKTLVTRGFASLQQCLKAKSWLWWQSAHDSLEIRVLLFQRRYEYSSSCLCNHIWFSSQCVVRRAICNIFGIFVTLFTHQQNFQKIVT